MKRHLPYLSLALCLLPGVVQASSWPAGMTNDELALLPRWCQHVQDPSGENWRPEVYLQYVQRYGPGWEHMHHYCYALVNATRLSRPSFPLAARSGAYTMAQADIVYVLQRTTKDFAFRPEILVTLARLHMRQGKFEEAAAAARALTDERPTIADGYALLAEALLRLKRRDDALAVLKKGDDAVTDQERYKRLKSILPLN